MGNNDIVLGNSSALSARLSNATLPAKTLKDTRNALAELSADVVVSEGKLEAGAFLSIVGVSHLGMLADAAEAVVGVHPAAAQGCAQILQAYGAGAADIVRRIVR